MNRPLASSGDGAEAPGAPAVDRLRLLEIAVSAAPNSVIITDENGTIEWVNPAFTATTGYTFAEAVGQKPTLLKSGSHSPAFYAEMWQTIRAGHNWHGEIINRRKNGELYAEDATIAPIRDAGGAIRHYVAIKLDITERRKAEEARLRLVNVIENSTDLVGQADPGGTIFYLNAAGLRLVGLSSPAEVLGRSITEFYTPESADHVLRVGIPTAIRMGLWKGETELVSRNGRIVPVSQTILVGHDAQGVVTHTSTIMRDLTEEKRAAAQLIEQAEVIDKAPIAIVIADLAHRVTYCNDGAAQLYGLPKDDMIGRTADDIFTPESMKQLARARIATLETGGWIGEMALVTRKGVHLQVEFHMTVIRNARGEPRARLSIGIDAREKKKLMEQFLRAQQLESVGMLAAGIAHDLNNVLAPILMGVPLLRERVTGAGDLHLLETLEKSAMRGAGLVRQILGFTHGLEGEPRLVQVKHLLRDIAAVIQETFPKSIELKDAIPTNLRPVMANPTQIHQVLLNLCVNARDAMPGGGVLGLRAENFTIDRDEAVTMDGGRPGEWVRIEVEDSGTGMSVEVQAHMWDPFFTTKGPGQGTGLGLPTVWNIVKKYNGFISVRSEVGRGSLFQVHLPAAEGTPGPEVTRSAVPRGSNELILVVDDESSICDLVSAVLTQHGFRAVCARDGIEAVGNFVPRSDDFSLVITDLSMPNMDGVALARVIRRLSPEMKILAISGVDKASQNFQREPNLADAFLPKPFKRDTLLAKVHELLQSTAKKVASPA